MEDNKSVKSTQDDNRKKNETAKKKPSSSEDFKRKYFDFYDDIKISDRQDW